MTAGPPRRPEISITPMQSPTPSRGTLHWLIVALWSAAVILLALGVVGALLHFSDLSHHLALAAVTDNVGTKLDDAQHAANVSLALGAGLAAITVVCAAVGLWRIVKQLPRWRNWLVTAAVAVALLAAGMYVTINASGEEMTAAGFSPAFQWAAVEAAAVGVIGTVMAFFVNE
ncbi:hypothetical protein HH308_15990 [Gordonia sp. TBRC 11910]|uniref:Uncharacterized protein n=1 Tax=Gordonia asplenii TaxID=2725283 RepID=A0A848KV07_9ACTN|nr:hypothetical protein [Gordonia asplenii]NMO02714.1 hypothetical protein [Gordonia asplenii]